ncbi:MAG: hypothetical protein U1F52_17085 [Burkholderiales bacterium]
MKRLVVASAAVIGGLLAMLALAATDSPESAAVCAREAAQSAAVHALSASTVSRSFALLNTVC